MTEYLQVPTLSSLYVATVFGTPCTYILSWVYQKFVYLHRTFKLEKKEKKKKEKCVYSHGVDTHQEPVVFEYVHFAHGTSPVLQKPRVDAALVEFVSARQYANGLGRPVRFDAHRATVAIADDLLWNTTTDRKSFIIIYFFF